MEAIKQVLIVEDDIDMAEALKCILEGNAYSVHLAYSPEVGQALKTLKEFNYARIYNNPHIKRETGKIEELFAHFFGRFLGDVKEHRHGSLIWVDFLSQMTPVYLTSHQPAEMVRDFLASMTDAYFLRQCQELFFPQPLPLKFA